METKIEVWNSWSAVRFLLYLGLEVTGFQTVNVKKLTCTLWINLEKIKTEYDKSKEKELLQEMLEVVEKREQLISDVEDAKKR